MKERSDKLFSIGLIFNGSEFIHNIYTDINLHWTELICDSDEEFNLKCDNIEKIIKKRDTE